MYTPPHHPNLQPIELVWAIVNGEVGRQYTIFTKFADIRERLDTAFKHFRPMTVQRCIDTANTQLHALKKHFDMLDDQRESSDSCSSDSKSDDQSD